MRYTKQQLLNWVDEYLEFNDILMIAEELMSEDEYREWLEKTAIKIIRKMNNVDLEDMIGADVLSKAVMPRIRRHKKADIVNAAVWTLGHDSKEAMFKMMSSDLEEEPDPWSRRRG